MGIAGSIVDHNFFELRLGMKVRAVDMTELRRRIDQKILRRSRTGNGTDGLIKLPLWRR